MNKKDQYKRLITFGSAVLLMAMLISAFGIVWYEFYSEAIMLPFYRRGNWVLIGIYTVMLFVFFKAYGGFRVGYLKRTDAFYSQMISIFCVNVISYFLISLIGRHFMNIIPIVIMTVIDFFFIGLWTYLTGEMYFVIYPPRKLVILYGSHQAASLVMKMSSRVDKYMICESVNINEHADKIKEIILKYEGVIICDIPAEQRNDYLKFCFENSLRAYIAPKISDIIVRGADDIRLFDTPLLLCRNGGLSFEQRFFKRAFDIILSLPAFIVLSPLMLIISIVIKISDGGPVLYKQCRLTQDGKEFNVLKFRSMVVDAEKNGGPQLCTENDDRITAVGKILRKCRFDEFPQLINVLRGDMSLVGPRPERPELVDEYKKQMPEFEYRLRVKAGLTGYAQVIGVYDTTPYDKLKMDLMYIENYSIRSDLQIVLMTLKTMLFPTKTNEATDCNVTGSSKNQNGKEEKK
ncbi:MAG: sugar transferase [Ruminococcus sp.]|nr:sugar transferase [Ruminococcus sp.]